MSKVETKIVGSIEEFLEMQEKLDKEQGVFFNISIINSRDEEVDRIEVKSHHPGFALIKAEEEFLAKNQNYILTDAGMFLGSNTRDLCVENNNTGEFEDFKLIISK